MIDQSHLDTVRAALEWRRVMPGAFALLVGAGTFAAGAVFGAWLTGAGPWSYDRQALKRLEHELQAQAQQLGAAYAEIERLKVVDLSVRGS